MPKKLDFRIKMGRNGRGTKITYEIHKIFILFFFRAENNALICRYDEVNRCTLRDAGVIVRASLAPTRCSNPVFQPGLALGLRPY